MSRIVIGLIVALALCSCTSADGNGKAADDVDAKSAKAEMDAEAQALLPDLTKEVGGELVGMKAGFYERSGFGMWDYEADGSIVRPPGTMATALDTTASVLTQHDFSVARDDDQKRVTGEKGNVSVIVQAALLTDDAEVSSLQVSMGTIDPARAGDEFAASAPREDYLTYLE
jgi:hypothetical protein